MCVAVVLVDGERLVEAGNRLLVALKRLQDSAAIGPGPKMLGRNRQRMIEREEGFGVTPQFDQRRPAIVQGLSVLRHTRKNGIEIGESLLVITKSRACDPPIEKRIPVPWIARQHRIEAGQCLFRTIERVQGVAAMEQGVWVAGPKGECLVDGGERLIVSFESVQDIGEIDQDIGDIRIDLQGGRYQAISFAHLPGLGIDQAKKMQGIEIVGRSLERAGVKLLCLAQTPLLMQAQRVLQNLRDIERP